MDEEKRAKEYAKGIKKDIKGYKKLKSLNKSEELDTFLDLLVKTAGDKMVWAFTGDNIKSWDDFCKVRGEIISYLYPIQEIRGADSMVKHLEQQLDSYYNNTID